MSEGMLGGILGGEEEKAEVEGPQAPAGVEAFAAAIAAKLAGNDPGVARKTEEFLGDQSELLRVQKKHLEDEHALRLAHLDHQAHLLRGQRVGQFLRIGFQVFVALIGTVIGVGFAVLLHDAFTSRRVIIETFATPPALAARGVTGTVVAAGVLDEITRLQNATHTSVAAKRDLSNAWSNEVKIAVPESGISLGEVSDLLKARFGDDLHIGGDLVETAAGALELTVRGTKVPAKTFSGGVGDLAKLQTNAARYVFAESQPVLWATYLAVPGHFEESIDFARKRVASVAPADRPYLLNIWGLDLQAIAGSQREAPRIIAAAIELKPDLWIARFNLQAALANLGDEEGAWRAGEVMRVVSGGRPGRASEYYFGVSDWLTWNLQAELAATIADANLQGGYASSSLPAGPATADIEARLHDPAAAQLAIDTTAPDDTDPTIEAGLHFARGELALASGDTALALNEMEGFGTLFKDLSVASVYIGDDCWIALAEEAAGHADKADAVLNAGGTFVDCYRFRGDILDGRGDWRGAQKAYADAVALAPDLPAGFYSWGVALAKHGDLAGAEGKLRDANQRGPHWADPLTAWGDVLMKTGKNKEALEKYDEALRYAPNWKQLKEARQAAAKEKS
jgi:tetratricopeptide (TPR) repeat protein